MTNGAYYGNFGTFTTSNVEKAENDLKGGSKIFCHGKCDEMDKNKMNVTKLANFSG